jgi:hypothetical protein
MILASDSGDRLELELLGYQFEESTDGWDPNWLLVRVEAEVDGRRWEATDPCLLAHEVSRLADWLECLADGVEVAPVTFLEPNLSFAVIERGGKHLRVRAWFELELRPSWAASDTAGERDLAADLVVTPEKLKDAAAALKEQLRRFPPRPRLG